jgi:alkylhydroperoxidase family enzyme
LPIIDPIPVEDIDSPKLQEMIATARQLNVPDDQFMQIMAHAPGYGEALFDAMYKSHALGQVDHQLKEIIRIQLARHAEDPYFSALRSTKAVEAGLSEELIDAGCGDFEDDERFSPAETWALNYARLMYTEPKKVNGDFYDQGRTHYSEAEIIELGAFIAFHYGLQVFMRTLNVTPLT